MNCEPASEAGQGRIMEMSCAKNGLRRGGRKMERAAASELLLLPFLLFLFLTGWIQIQCRLREDAIPDGASTEEESSAWGSGLGTSCCAKLVVPGKRILLSSPSPDCFWLCFWFPAHHHYFIISCCHHQPWCSHVMLPCSSCCCELVAPHRSTSNPVHRAMPYNLS